MQFYYASRDGQSRRIAERIASRLAEAGIAASPTGLTSATPPLSELSKPGPLVLVAAVRYGKHLPEARQLLANYRRLSSPPPLVLLSVNLTARKAGKQSAEGSVYLRKVIGKYQLKPVLAQAIAGRLDYPRYSWGDRQAIRFIMMLTGGPTDPTAQVEFTDWDQVDSLARRIAELCTPHP
jgi:menaquinone-dependent protoporphyrinogen oxidase